MEALGGVLAIVGLIIAAIGGIWFIVVTFQESVLWGLACMFVPFVSLVFLVMFWDEAKTPFLVNVVGILVMFGGGAMAGGG